MRDFYTALQFLTRIPLQRTNEWHEEDFGRSVKYFPLVGAVIGTLYLTASLILLALPGIPPHLTAAILLLLTLIITGGIFYDGFMDTMDGIFSGRSREKMLAIMKDSTVGANAVMTFVLLMITDYALIMDFPAAKLPFALFIMPIVSRLAVVTAITCFPYARPQGMGKAFADHADKKTLPTAAGTTLLFVLPGGADPVVALSGGLLFAWLFLRYTTKILGGVTGDVYGAVATLTETVVLFLMLIL